MEQINGDKKVQREPDLHGDPSDSQKAVLLDDRVDRMEKNVAALDGKLDYIIEKMKERDSRESEDDEIIEGWSENIAKAWDEAKPRGRPKHKKTKTTKPRNKRRPCRPSKTCKKKVKQRNTNVRGFTQMITNLRDHQRKFMFV